MPQIEVAFDIDANGILNVSAKDMATGKQQQITITASSGLAKEEVDRMVGEAEAHAADDARRREEIELRNQTDSLVYSTERTLAEYGAKLSTAERNAAEQAMNEAKEALRGDDLERIRRAQEGLTRASQSLGEAVHRASQQAAAAGAAKTEDSDVVDAEVVDADSR